MTGAMAKVSFRLTIRNVNSHHLKVLVYNHHCFRLTIRNVNSSKKDDDNEIDISFRLTIRNVNLVNTSVLSPLIFVLD